MFWKIRRSLRERSIFWALWPKAHDLASRGYVKTAEILLRLAHAMRPNDLTVIYPLGTLKALRGDLPNAIALFKKDVEVPTSLGVPTFTRALCFDQCLGMRRSRTVSIDFQQLPKNVPIYFVSGDSEYFCKYVADLARSIHRHAPGFHLYAHIVNADDCAIALAKTVQGLGVSFSFETTDLSGLNELQRKTYYSVSRYLLLPAIRRFCSAEIIVADFDQLVVGDLSELLTTLDGADLSMIELHENVCSLMSYYTATVIALSGSQAAAKFADKLAANLSHSLSDDRNLVWHLDQAALAITKLSDCGLRFRPMPRHLVNFGDTPDDTAVLWSATRSIPEGDDRQSTRGWREHVTA